MVTANTAKKLVEDFPIDSRVENFEWGMFGKVIGYNPQENEIVVLETLLCGDQFVNRWDVKEVRLAREV